MWIEPAFGWVVFTDAASPSWLKLLRPGMRHCFVLLAKEDCVLRIDPLLNLTLVDRIHWHGLPWLFRMLLAGGATILPVDAPVLHRRRRMGLPLHSCVEVVKRVLAIDERLILTPHQLFDHLMEQRLKLILDRSENSL